VTESRDAMKGRLMHSNHPESILIRAGGLDIKTQMATKTKHQ